MTQRLTHDVPITSSTPLISVVIATCNDWGPLEHCLRSLEYQPGAPEFEVIVVDDGSSQPVPSTMRRRERLHSFTLLQQPHAGISQARNRGIAHARGEIVLFTDSDCRLEPNCLERLAE